MSQNEINASGDDKPFYDDAHDQSVPLPVALMIGVAVLSSLGDHNGKDSGKKLQGPFVQAAVAAPAASAPQIKRDAHGCAVLVAGVTAPACK